MSMIGKRQSCRLGQRPHHQHYSTSRDVVVPSFGSLQHNKIVSCLKLQVSLKVMTASKQQKISPSTGPGLHNVPMHIVSLHLVSKHNVFGHQVLLWDPRFQLGVSLNVWHGV
jgi:hypothetical protein